MNEKVLGGDLVIATSAIKSGTPNEYIPKSYPAVADFEVVKADALKARKIKESINVRY